MGNYIPARLPEPTLKRNLGLDEDLGGTAGAHATRNGGGAGPEASRIPIESENAGVKDKGIIESRASQVALALPPGAKVVKTTGEGYRRRDAMTRKPRSRLAVWRIAKMAAGRPRT